MGIAFILVGLAAAGVVVDFAIENDLAGAPERSFALFGGSFTVNETQVVLGAAVLGALAVLFVAIGIGLFRGSWGRRRAVRHRVVALERENAELRSRARAATVVKSEPHADAEVESGPARRGDADQEHSRP